MISIRVYRVSILINFGPANTPKRARTSNTTVFSSCWPNTLIRWVTAVSVHKHWCFNDPSMSSWSFSHEVRLDSCLPVWGERLPLPQPSESTARYRWPGLGYSVLNQRPSWGTCQKPPDSHQRSIDTAARSHLKYQHILSTQSYSQGSVILCEVCLLFPDLLWMNGYILIILS